MTTKSVVGMIGVGPMGHGIAANILKGGYALHVKGNRNRGPVEDLVAAGATEAADARAMAEACDIVHLCLSNSDQVEALIRGADGFLASGRTGLTVIDCSTSNPVSTMALAAELEDAGMKLIDAPLGRTPKEAEAGMLDAMVGASDEDFARVKPILECWAGNITHVGPTGSGHKMKLIMNFISMGYAALYGEAVVLGAKVGLPPEMVRQVIGSSRLSNGFFETFMKYAVERDRNAHVFSIANASKDVRYAAAMASEAGNVNVMGAAVKHYFTHAEAIGRGGDYVPMIVDIIGALNGVDMEAEARKATD
jgi:3-hydroxyisobutyrate dehydrogenase-like beta-hydroxyacid dehydrogenase